MFSSSFFLFEARITADPETSHIAAADLWTTRIRSGSKAERACQKWSVEASLVLKTTFDYLISNYAEGRHRPKAFDDVLNILILNSREGYKNCEAFLVSLCRVFSFSHSVWLTSVRCWAFFVELHRTATAIGQASPRRRTAAVGPHESRAAVVHRR